MIKNLLKNKKSKYELLAPAGSFPALIAAIRAGADAVYFGLQEFSMRAFAKNFSFSDLPKIRKICDTQSPEKSKKVKMYLTLNTIIYDNEIKKIDKIIAGVAQKKLVDAIICWDLSVIELCRKHKVPFHISTQASISNSKTAEFYKKLGAERAILARELNLKQIKQISHVMPVETFIHGAMCVSISGRCFTSQFMQNLSANRGECAHPCRRAYNITDEEGNKLKLENNRVMSAKDLCTLPYIEQLKKAGITSFKIEGRNRSPEYVSTVVSVYRKALDKKLSKSEIAESLEQLKKVYNRGFSSGFYFYKPGPKGFSTTENGEQLESKKYIGRVEKYFPKINVAIVSIHNSGLHIGDEIYIIGNQTGLIRTSVKSMEINKKPLKQAKKSQQVGIKLPLCKKGDEIFLIQTK